MLNKIVLMGRLTKNPVLRYTNTNNIPVASFSLAVARRYQKDREVATDFFDIVAWQGSGEFAHRNFTKGQQVCVDGRLQQSKWFDQNGNTRYSVEVVAESLHFAGSKRADEQEQQTDPANATYDSYDHYDPYLEDYADAA